MGSEKVSDTIDMFGTACDALIDIRFSNALFSFHMKRLRNTPVITVVKLYLSRLSRCKT